MAENGQQTLGERLGAYLSSKVSGPGADKRLAQMLNCDPRAARNIFAGYWPGARQWRSIVRRFGREVLEAVFEPEIDDVLARQKAAIRELEKELHDQKARLRSVAGATSDLVETEDR